MSDGLPNSTYPATLPDLNRWLLSEQSNHWLTQTQKRLENSDELHQIVKSLRRDLTAERAGAAIDMAHCRIRGRIKFDRAAEMYFTRVTLEMATDEMIAKHKAARFDHVRNLADVCCGIGGDLIGLAGRKSPAQTIGFDSDPIAAAYAQANLLIHGLSGETRACHFNASDLNAFDAIHADPERRTSGKQTRGDRFSPPLELLIHNNHNISKSIKVAPATELTNDLPGCEIEWVGHSRECKQQILWTGDLAKHVDCLTATVIDQGRVSQFVRPKASVRNCLNTLANHPEPYLYEPHNTLIAAGLVDAFAEQYGLRRMHQSIAYLTGHREVQSGMLSRFEMLEAMPADFKRVSASLRKYQFGELAIKKRGVDENVFRQFQKIKLEGDEPNGTLILTEIQGQVVALIARRI